MPKLPAKNLSNLHYYLMVQDLHSVIRGHSWSCVVIRGHLCVLLDMIRGFAKIQDYNTFLIY